MGSAFYARHPLVPLAKTVADLNLEVVGRTDGPDGVEKDRASLTGFDYSTVAEVLQRAGRLVGVTVYKNEHASDAFFDRSDNLSLAKHGVPAHSLCTVFMYPDYHRVSDEWNKIDYQNLEHVTRAVALGLIMIAEDPKAPVWNQSNPKAGPYHKAWQSEHPSEPNELDKSQSR